MRKLLKIAIIAFATGGLLVPSSPANAATFSQNGSLSSGPFGSFVCADALGTKACFGALGDKIWVRDTRADGHHSDGDLLINGNLFICHNFKGQGSWVVCNDWADRIPEHDTGWFCAQTMEGNTLINQWCRSVGTT